MGKSRNSPNLYEILRTASGRTGNGGTQAPTDRPGNVATITPPPAPSPATTTKIEPVPAPPKVAAPSPDKDSRLETVELPPQHKMVTPVVRPPMPSQTALLNPMATTATPPGSKYVTPRPAESPRLFTHDPGDRSVRVSYNALLFAGLIVFCLVIASYMIGSRSGRGPVEPAAVNPNNGAEAPLTQKKWTIQLVEFQARGAEMRATANAAASKLKIELEKLNYKNAEIVLLGTAPDQRMALLYGRFADRDSREAKDVLNALKAVKIGKDPKEPNFAKSAIFVAAQ